jgi:aldehyde:ferredoxin oxidoreductase
VWEIFNDSGVYCNFNSFGVSRNGKLDFYKAVTGCELKPEEWSKLKGLRILQLQRALLLLGGPDVKWKPGVHDENPPRFYEPLPSGPYKGKTVKKARVGEDKKRYFKEAGWDERGIPGSEMLEKLGLEDVDQVLGKLR